MLAALEEAKKAASDIRVVIVRLDDSAAQFARGLEDQGIGLLSLAHMERVASTLTAKLATIRAAIRTMTTEANQ
jgi:LPS sulfotransferase NodH